MAKNKKSAKKPAPKAPAKKPAAKVAHAKTAHAKPVQAKPAAKAHAVKAPARKAPPAKLPAPKAQPAKAPIAKAPVTKVTSLPPPKGSKAPMSAADIKRKILERKVALKAIAFSLDEVREIAKKNETAIETATKNGKAGTKSAPNGKAAELAATLEKPHKPNHIKPASLADILGFNPAKGRKPALHLDESLVPEKFKRYYKLLIELRQHVLVQLGEHAEETLLKSAKDDTGDLSISDSGTDTFDRDFALSLVSSEQEALSEIEAAIKRVHAGTYGICESTQQPIAKDRLLAVPFTRYSAEAKKIVERHSHREQQRGGLFGEAGEEDGGGKIPNDGGED